MNRRVATAADVARTLRKAGVTDAALAEEGLTAEGIGQASDIVGRVVRSTPPNRRHFLAVVVTPEGTQCMTRGDLIAMLRGGDLADLADQVAALPYRMHFIAVLATGEKAPPSVALLPLAMVAS